MIELEMREEKMGVELTEAAEKAIEQDNVRRDYPVSLAEAYGETERMGYELGSRTLEAMEFSRIDGFYDEEHISTVFGEEKAAV